MDQDVKDFVDKVKDEFKKMRVKFDELQSSYSALDARITLLENPKKEEKHGWFD